MTVLTKVEETKIKYVKQANNIIIITIIITINKE